MALIFGHRGGRGDGWPAENTLEAFTRAEGEGADGIELDVRLCASGEVIVFHDRSLARATAGRDTRDAATVARRDLPRLAGASIPTLGEALDVARRRIVNVELKADVPSRRALARAVAREVERSAHPEIVFSSFDPTLVLMMAALAPRTPRALLVGPRERRIATPFSLAMSPAIVAAHLDVTLATETRITRLRRAGLRVVAWTVNDVSRAAELARRGVEWIITDRPGALRAALESDRDAR